MIADEGCAERGCPMHDGTPGVQMVEKKKWRGLTDEEMRKIWDNGGWYVTLFKKVEAKLKEKNSA